MVSSVFVTNKPSQALKVLMCLAVLCKSMPQKWYGAVWSIGLTNQASCLSLQTTVPTCSLSNNYDKNNRQAGSKWHWSICNGSSSNLGPIRSCPVCVATFDSMCTEIQVQHSQRLGKTFKLGQENKRYWQFLTNNTVLQLQALGRWKLLWQHAIPQGKKWVCVSFWYRCRPQTNQVLVEEDDLWWGPWARGEPEWA